MLHFEFLKMKKRDFLFQHSLKTNDDFRISDENLGKYLAPFRVEDIVST